MASTRPWLAQGLQVLVIGLVVVDSMAVTVLLPRMAADFDSSRDAAIWVVNLYQMVVLGLLLPLAALGQQIGFKRIYLGGLLVLGGGALLSAAAPTLPLLVLARVVQGIGGGAVDGESDAMYDQAVAVVLQHRKASISLVQRHLRIGYNRAARLLEQMEKSGLVGSMQTNGSRELIVPKRDEGA